MIRRDHVRKHVWRQGAFSIVELLVVVTVIGVLAAILLPTLEQGVESARKMQCANQLKQLHTVTITYANDMRGRIPGVVDPYGTYWSHGVLGTHLKTAYGPHNIPELRGKPHGVGLLYEFGYAPDPTIFYCPGRIPSEYYGKDYPTMGWGCYGNPAAQPAVTSYYMAAGNLVLRNGAVSEDMSRYHSLNSPPDLFMGFDAWEYRPEGGWPADATGFWGAPKHRHGRGYNFVFFGGHVRWWNDEQEIVQLGCAQPGYDTYPYIGAFVHNECWRGPWSDFMRYRQLSFFFQTKVVGWSNAQWAQLFP